MAGPGWQISSPPSQHLEISETHAAKPRLKKLLVVQEHLLDGGERGRLFIPPFLLELSKLPSPVEGLFLLPPAREH